MLVPPDQFSWKQSLYFKCMSGLDPVAQEIIEYPGIAGYIRATDKWRIGYELKDKH